MEYNMTAATAAPIDEAARELFLWHMLRSLREKLRENSGKAPRDTERNRAEGVNLTRIVR